MMGVNIEKTVLVMDDELSTLKGVERLAKPRGIHVQNVAGSLAIQQWFEAHGGARVCHGRAYCLVLDVKYLGEVLNLAAWRDMPRYPLICIGREPISNEVLRNLVAERCRYLAKPFILESMAEMIEAALEEYTVQGHQWRKEQTLRQGFSRLTRREAEVCALVVKGFTNLRISEQLGITVKTVKAHRAKVMTKTGVASLAELIRAYDSLDGDQTAGRTGTFWGMR